VLDSRPSAYVWCNQAILRGERLDRGGVWFGRLAERVCGEARGDASGFQRGICQSLMAVVPLLNTRPRAAEARAWRGNAEAVVGGVWLVGRWGMVARAGRVPVGNTGRPAQLLLTRLPSLLRYVGARRASSPAERRSAVGAPYV